MCTLIPGTEQATNTKPRTPGPVLLGSKESEMGRKSPDSRHTATLLGGVDSKVLLPFVLCFKSMRGVGGMCMWVQIPMEAMESTGGGDQPGGGAGN